jgi:hypothetical protein
MTIEPRESGFLLKRLAALSDFQRKKGNENGDDSDAGCDDKAYKCKHQRKLARRPGPLKLFALVWSTRFTFGDIGATLETVPRIE